MVNPLSLQRVIYNASLGKIYSGESRFHALYGVECLRLVTVENQGSMLYMG
jgi:hypothetical protein